MELAPYYIQIEYVDQFRKACESQFEELKQLMKDNPAAVLHIGGINLLSPFLYYKRILTLKSEQESDIYNLDVATLAFIGTKNAILTYDDKGNKYVNIPDEDYPGRFATGIMTEDWVPDITEAATRLDNELLTQLTKAGIIEDNHLPGYTPIQGLQECADWLNENMTEE